MDRRGFLKMLGKGAAAAVAPKGAIAKALTNTLTKAPKVDIGKAILDYISVYDDSIKVPLPPAGKYYRMAGIVSNLLKAGTHYGVVNADDDFSDLLRHEFQYYNDKAEFLDGKKGISEIFGGEYKGLYGDEDVNAIQKLKHKFTLDLDHLVDNFDSHTINPIITFSYKNNLISPEQQTELENYGFYKHEYIEDVSSKEKQFDDKQKRQEGPDRRSDIDYSRMDKAGGAEDEGYAKYYEKVKTFDTLVEAMDRRDFLKWLSKGASIAGVSPSTVGKMAMNLANSPSTEGNFIKNWIINHYQLLNGGSGSTVQDIEGIKNSYQAILTFLTNKGLKTDWVEDKISAVENWFDDDVIKNALKDYGYDIDDHFTNFIEAGIDGDADYEIYAILFKNNLIDEEMQKYLSKRGIEKQDHITYEDEIKREQEKQKRKEDERKQIAKDINYSRMDKAGSAEDEGYAKYYEKVNTFDSLLSILTEDDDSFDHLFQNLDTVFYCVIVNWSNIESSGVRVFKNADEFINYYNRCMDGLIASNHSEFFNPANCKKISILDNYYNELIEDIKRFGFIAVGAYPNKSIYFALSKDDVITAAAGDIAEDGDQLYEKIVAILQTKFNKLKG